MVEHTSATTTSSAKLVGNAIIEPVTIENMEVQAFLDSGSQVSTISKSLADKLGLPISTLQEYLSLQGAGGHSIPYLGVVHAELVSKDWTRTITAPLLVLEDNSVNSSVPVLLGTNVLTEVTAVHDSSSWQAIKSLVYEVVATARTTRQEAIGPGERKFVQVATSKACSNQVVIAEESALYNLPGGLLLVPSLTCVDANAVIVQICNVTQHTVTIPQHRNICSLYNAGSAFRVCDVKSINAHVPVNETTREDFLSRFKLADSLDATDLEAVKDILWKNRDVFSTGPLDIGCTPLVKHEIKLTDDTPFRQRFRRIPPSMFEEVRQHVQDMLDVGAIRPSHSPYASPVVLVRKKDNTLRFCLDLRKLNSLTIRDAYSLPRIDETLELLGGASWFSSLDLSSGYWQCELREEDKQKTAFTVGPLGFYECNRMAFGLTNAPATFQRLMELALGPDVYLNFALVYLDDIIVHSQDFASHLQRLDAVFGKLRTANLKLKPSKCEFFKQELKYLGHVVSKQGISPDPEKVTVLKSWPSPKSVEELRSFLGFVGYYRRFCKDFSRVAKPLHEMLGNKAASGFQWTSEHETAFRRLISQCAEAPVLAYADFKKPFSIHVDASRDGLGAVLYQTIDGVERPVAFASRSVSKTEKNYPAHRLEFLAMKWAITDKFADYLHNAKFAVWTDNNPLTYVMTSAKLDATTQRWVAALANYDFTIHYKPGSANKEADALSRIHWPTMSEDVVSAVITAVLTEDPMCVSLGCSANVHVVADDAIGKSVDWKSKQKKDAVLRTAYILARGGRVNRRKLSSEEKAFYWHRKHLTVKDGVMYRKSGTELRLILPRDARAQAIKQCHDDLGHLGRDKTVDVLRQRFFWPKMNTEISQYVTNCTVCLKAKARPDRAPLVNITTSQPLELVCTDYLTVEPDGKYSILVMTDHFTRFSVAVPTRNQTAKTTADALLKHFILPFGMPSRLHSDQGRNFESKIIRTLCQALGITRSRTTPYHPAGNGAAERFNQSLISMLRTLDDAKKRHWREHLGTLVHAYNTSWCSATGYSPYYLMFGRHPKLPIDLAFGLRTSSDESSTVPEYVQKCQSRFKEAYKVAQETISKEHGYRKKTYDTRVRGACLDKGDLVLIKKNVRTTKIDPFWENDQFEVLERPDPSVPVYKVKRLNGSDVKTLHRNQLLPLPTFNPEQRIGESETSDHSEDASDSESSAQSEVASDPNTYDNSEDEQAVRPKRNARRPDFYNPAVYS